MDLDAFAALRGPDWARLEELTRRRRLSGADVDELVRLYQAAATDLSTVRSTAPDPSLISRLSQILVRARSRITGSHDPSWRDLARFAVVTLPAALYRIRWWSIAVTAACTGLALVAGVWLAHSPESLTAIIGTPSERDQYAREAFESYYSNYPAPSFAAQVWTNNAWIAAQCVAFGISGLWPLWVLAANALNVGAAGAVMAEAGRLDIFFALIAPHGMLELTAIFVAGAAGLRLFWTMVDPGPRPRGRALAEEGRSLFTVALGLVGVLAVSGAIEGFVTPSALPWWLKSAIGALALAAFWVYTWWLGGRAARSGETGDLDAWAAGDVQPVAA